MCLDVRSLRKKLVIGVRYCWKIIRTIAVEIALEMRQVRLSAAEQNLDNAGEP